MERIFPEALVLHFKHPKPQNSSLKHNPLWPKTPDQFKPCLSKKCKMYFDAHPLLQQRTPPAIKSPAYPGLTFDVPELYFIQCTAAFLVVLLLKTTSISSWRPSPQTKQTTVLFVRESFSQNRYSPTPFRPDPSGKLQNLAHRSAHSFHKSAQNV